MKEYRGFRITTEPGMCCPSFVIWNGNIRLHKIPFDDPSDGERKVCIWIDNRIEGVE